jgi:hypothetical protein
VKKWREQHQVTFEAVEIIDSADNDRKLRIKELPQILSRNPELNKQLGSQSEYEIKHSSFKLIRNSEQPSSGARIRI